MLLTQADGLAALSNAVELFLGAMLTIAFAMPITARISNIVDGLAPGESVWPSWIERLSASVLLVAACAFAAVGACVIWTVSTLVFMPQPMPINFIALGALPAASVLLVVAFGLHELSQQKAMAISRSTH